MTNRLSKRHERKEPRAAGAGARFLPRTTPYLGTLSDPTRGHVHAPLQFPGYEQPLPPISGATTIEAILAMEIPEPIDPPIYAVTSLSPSASATTVQRNCIRSWRIAGLRVVAFNHPSEITELRSVYDGVDFVPVEQTAIQIFGKHYVHISSMLLWAVERDESVLLINSDILLHVPPGRMAHLRNITSDGLAHISRHNHGGDISRAVAEKWGIDGFLFHGKNANGIHSSLFAMGQPAWDWWLPYMFMVIGKPLYSVRGHRAYHQKHPINWSNHHHHLCASELVSIARLPVNEVRQNIELVSKEIWIG